MKQYSSVFFMILFCGIAAAQHEHGKVTIGIALDQQELSIELRAPAANVVGFEHAARTAQQRLMMEKTYNWLKAGRDLFGVPGSAACRLLSTEIRAPGAPAGTHEHEHEHEHEHQDYEARFTYHCTNPEALAWIELWLLEKILDVATAQADIITAQRQTSQEITSARQRVVLR
jgi:hypothetical protein